MRYLIPILLSSLFVVSACGDKAAKAGSVNPVAAVGDAAKQVAAVDKLKAPIGELMKTLGTITDGASAEKAKSGLEGIVGTLKTQMGDLGGLGKLGDAAMSAKDGLLKPVLEKVTGLLGNADIKKAIGPVLEQLQGLISAK